MESYLYTASGVVHTAELRHHITLESLNLGGLNTLSIHLMWSTTSEPYSFIIIKSKFCHRLVGELPAIQTFTCEFRYLFRLFCFVCQVKCSRGSKACALVAYLDMVFSKILLHNFLSSPRFQDSSTRSFKTSQGKNPCWTRSEKWFSGVFIWFHCVVKTL